jgi:hypothetical protein
MGLGGKLVFELGFPTAPLQTRSDLERLDGLLKAGHDG